MTTFNEPDCFNNASFTALHAANAVLLSSHCNDMHFNGALPASTGAANNNANNDINMSGAFKKILLVSCYPNQLLIQPSFYFGNNYL
jgi:hypothetical protein